MKFRKLVFLTILNWLFDIFIFYIKFNSKFLVYKKYDEWIHFEKFWDNLVFTPITAGDSDNENVFVEVRSVEDQTKLV